MVLSCDNAGFLTQFQWESCTPGERLLKKKQYPLSHADSRDIARNHSHRYRLILSTPCKAEGA